MFNNNLKEMEFNLFFLIIFVKNKDCKNQNIINKFLNIFLHYIRINILKNNLNEKVNYSFLNLVNH